MMLFIYRSLVVPLALFLLPAFTAFNRKLRRGLSLRMRRRIYPKFPRRPIWIHASSGEFEYAKPLIRELKKRNPGIPIVATYFSPTFALSVENFPGVDFALPLPLDLPLPCRRFLRQIDPRLGLIARTDFWPEILAQARRRKIPVEVFSYTQRAGAVGWLTRFRAGLVRQIHCVTTDDLENLEKAAVTCALDVLGDTRYDQVRYRLEHPKPIPEALKPERFCVVAGSTWEEDEKVLLPGLLPLLRGRQIQLILVPHEPTDAHIAKLRAELRLAGLTYALFSQGRSWAEHPVLVVDKVGVLAELYLWADVAYVGGSFGRGVHSVMEALGAGCLTLVGPRHDNNREAVEFKQLLLSNRPPLTEVRSSADVQSILEAAFKDQPGLAALSEAIGAEFESRLGATMKLVEHLSPLLND